MYLFPCGMVSVSLAANLGSGNTNILLKITFACSPFTVQFGLNWPTSIPPRLCHSPLHKDLLSQSHRIFRVGTIFKGHRVQLLDEELIQGSNPQLCHKLPFPAAAYHPWWHRAGLNEYYYSWTATGEHKPTSFPTNTDSI